MAERAAMGVEARILTFRILVMLQPPSPRRAQQMWRSSSTTKGRNSICTFVYPEYLNSLTSRVSAVASAMAAAKTISWGSEAEREGTWGLRVFTDLVSSAPDLVDQWIRVDRLRIWDEGTF